MREIQVSVVLITMIVLLLGSQQHVTGQDDIRFDHISMDEGLSQNDINCIYQDAQGYMWFGTHDGLNKYDGYEFTIYRPEAKDPHSINSNLVYKITGDESGNLWIGTTGHGLNYFDRATERFTSYRYDKNDESSIGDDHVTDLYLDQKNRLWVGTNDGLSMADLTKKEEGLSFLRFNPDQDPFNAGWDAHSIYEIFEDSKGQLWVGGYGGLYMLSRDQNGDIYFRLVNHSIGLPDIPVRYIAEDREGRLVLGTPEGLYAQKDSKSSFQVYKISESDTYSFVIDDDNQIWAGGNNGLEKFDFRSGTLPVLKAHSKYDPIDPYSLSKDLVVSICKDVTGIIWVGTNGGGVNKFDPERKQFQTIRKTQDPQSLSYDKIRSIFEDSNGSLWVGTEGGGLNMTNQKSGYSKFTLFENLDKAFAIEEVERAGKKYLMIGCQNSSGLFELDITDPSQIREDKFVPYNEVDHSIFSIIEDSRMNLWLGTYARGLQRWIYDERSDTYAKDILSHNAITEEGISSNIIRSILEDRNGDIWLGTGSGLNRIKYRELLKEEPKVDVYKNERDDIRSLSYDYILPLYESHDGTIWIGTFGGGLNKFVPANEGEPEHFISYSEADGLSNNVIKAILEDDQHNLWLSTNKGLSRFDPIQEVFKNYDVNDGLQSNEFQELAGLKKRNGEMLFGGVNGFDAFFPNDIEDNDREAETVITRLTISNQTINTGEEVNGRVILPEALGNTDEIVLHYGENSFSLEFAALHYAAPLKNKFAYKLEGFRDEWVYTTAKKRFATYTNLQPGSYKLLVKASNNDGVWDSTPTELGIRVVPPFWMTNWAWGFYVLTLGAMLWWFRRYTIIRTTEKHDLILEHIEKEKHEDVQRMKLEFFTNISHEFRTPLTLIKGPLEYLQKSGGALDKDEVQDQYSLIQKNADYLLRLVNQLLDFRKMDQGQMRLLIKKGDAVAFIKEIGEPFQFLAHKRKIDYTLILKESSITNWFDPEALEKIMNNLLSNAFKFTPDGGRITIEVGRGEYTPVKQKKDKDSIVEQLKIVVADSGPGIPQHQLKHIFDRFYIEDDKTERNKQGVGIGLSFTKNLTELHQGHITVSSDQNRGTAFTVYLPMHRKYYEGVPNIKCQEGGKAEEYLVSAQYEARMITDNDEIIDNGLSKTRSKLPVLLVVDDNADIRKFIRLGLDKDYTIVEAVNGKQALEVAAKVIPNIILSDVLMPVMDGLEFCQEIRSREDTSHIPILILTAKSSQESELEVLNSGADDYLRKPFNMDLLQFKLSNIIEQRDQLRKKFNRDVTLRPSEVTVTSKDQKFLEFAIQIVEQHMSDTEFNVEKLAREIGFSRSNLYLKFKELTGLSSSEFIRSIRLKRAVELFEKSDYSVKEIMYMTGFSTASYFSKCFKKQFSMTPSDYIKMIKKGNEAV